MSVRYKITVNPRYVHLREFVERVPHRGEELGEVIYKARNAVYVNRETSTALCIKSFKVPPLYNRVAYTFLRKSKARRSYENALQLLDAGFLTPEPVAYVEVYSSGLLERSYYISLMVDARNVREWQQRPDGDRIADGVAQLLHRLHSAGVWHCDFSPGNVLVDADYRYYLIDINRMRFGVTSRKKLISNFKSINMNVEATEHLARLYARYAGIADVDDFMKKVMREFKSFWTRCHRKNARRERRRLKREARNVIKTKQINEK